MEGLRKEGVRFVLTRHETGAAFIAEAMGATTGIPGVCISTLGPGATNMVTGVAQAYLDRSPLLAFSAQLPNDRYAMCTHQQIDLLALYQPVTKWAASVTPRNTEAVLAKAARIAGAERPGPVYLQVPSDVPGQPATEPAHDRYGAQVVMAGAFDTRALQTAAALVRKARRPLIITGTDALRAGAGPELLRLAEAWRTPVMVGPKAKGIFPEDHPLFLGTVEMLGFGFLFDVVSQCDVVVMAGFDPVELDEDWQAGSTIINVGPVINEELYYPSAVDIVGPVGGGLRALREAAGEVKGWPEQQIDAVRKAFYDLLHPDLPGLLPQGVLEVLREVGPRSLMLTCDVGSNKAVTGQMWRAFEPHSFLMSNGLSSMGYGLPAAMGMKLARPERPVATVVGDGGLGMCLAELETAARLNLDLTVIVLVDEALDMIMRNQERKGYEAVGTSLTSPDYMALARAFRCTGRSVDSEAELQTALQAAMNAPGLHLIAAQINRQAYKLPASPAPRI